MNPAVFQAASPPQATMIALFPTYARRTDRGWRATVAGMVSRPLPERSRRRTLAIAVLKRLLELDDAELDSDVFRRRADSFLFQRVPGRRVRVRIGERVVDAGRTDRSGHFAVTVDLDDEVVAAAAAGSGCRWLDCTAVPEEEGDEPPAEERGRIQCVADAGPSVISDIDDTVKVSHVADRRELLRNTLLREFVPVPGMPEVYRRWEEAGAAFHYVSASPWQLSNCLCAFLGAAGLPGGSMHLKLFRLKDSTPLGRLPSRKRSKRRTIERIMEEFPGRRFLLVGDSGERDPEVYAAVAKRRADQVAGIAIRQVEGKAPRDKVRSRLDRLARRLPPGLIRVFESAADLGDLGDQPLSNAF